MKECIHDKVYANCVLTSNPPQYPWICKKCGEKGIDHGMDWTTEYEDLVKKFEVEK